MTARGCDSDSEEPGCTAPLAQASEAEGTRASESEFAASSGRRCKLRAAAPGLVLGSAVLVYLAACAYRSERQGRRWLRTSSAEDVQTLEERDLHASLAVAAPAGSATSNTTSSATSSTTFSTTPIATSNDTSEAEVANLSDVQDWEYRLDRLSNSSGYDYRADQLTADWMPTTTIRTTTVSPAPLYEFYMYRANSAQAKKFKFGNTNTGNLDGVVWYLMNEVVTMYTEGSRCPRKFNISQINRYKVKTRATKELFETGVNFGTRFSYDFGMCMGRCFADNQCSGEDDCDYHYEQFGYNVGCNNFGEHYPFPDGETAAPQGTWYALPLDGRCEGEPTGEKDCTWSYEEAGVLKILDIEATNPWGDNCCPAERCTGFWQNLFDEGATSWRVQEIKRLFREKYPDDPEDLDPSPCDFYKDSWYTFESDIWPAHDPWEKANKKAEREAAKVGNGTTKVGSEEWKDDSYNK